MSGVPTRLGTGLRTAPGAGLGATPVNRQTPVKTLPTLPLGVGMRTERSSILVAS